jgi:hypothetical protein
MASKAIKGYKFVFGGKSRPGIVGVKPKSGGVIDEFKSRKLKQLGRTQRKLKSQDKEMGEAIEGAKKKGLSRKDTVKGRKFQRDNRRAQREGDKLRKDVLRAGRAKGGMAAPMRPRDKRKPIDTRRKKRENFAPREDLKRPTPDQKGLQKLPEKVRNKMGYMKDGGKVKKFPDLSGDGKVTKKDILMGRGVIKKKNGKKKFGGGKK